MTTGVVYTLTAYQYEEGNADNDGPLAVYFITAPRTPVRGHPELRIECLLQGGGRQNCWE